MDETGLKPPAKDAPKRGGSSAENVTPETQKRILDAFEIFDHDHNKTVDAREIGTIIRFLGGSIQKAVRDRSLV